MEEIFMGSSGSGWVFRSATAEGLEKHLWQCEGLGVLMWGFGGLGRAPDEAGELQGQTVQAPLAGGCSASYPPCLGQAGSPGPHLYCKLSPVLATLHGTLWQRRALQRASRCADTQRSLAQHHGGFFLRAFCFFFFFQIIFRCGL